MALAGATVSGAQFEPRVPFRRPASVNGAIHNTYEVVAKGAAGKIVRRAEGVVGSLDPGDCRRRILRLFREEDIDDGARPIVQFIPRHRPFILRRTSA